MSEQVVSRTLEEELAKLGESVRRQRELSLDVLLKGVVLIGGLTILVLLYTAAITGLWSRLVPFLGLYAVLLTVALVKRLGHNLRAGLLIFLTYALGVHIVQMNGLDSSGSWFLLLAPFLVFLLLGNRAGAWAMVLSIAIYAFFAFAHYYEMEGWVAVELPYSPTSARQVLNMAGSFVLVLVVIGLVEQRVTREQARSLERIREHIIELSEAREELEEQAIELNRANQQAQKRAWQLQAAADVLRATRGISDLDTLLQEAVRSFQAQFHEYGVDGVGVYVLSSDEGAEREDERRFAIQGEVVLRASVGSLPSSVPEIVKMTLRSGKAGLIEHSDPPGTEMALPLRGRAGALYGARFEGILYIHSSQTDVFYEDDLSILQVLADQLSIVIQNVVLLQQAQSQLREMRVLYRQYSRDVWRDVAQAQAVFRYDRALGSVEVSSLEEEELVLPARDALQEGRPVVTSADDEPERVSLALPIKVRDTVIGVVHAEGKVAGGLSRDRITLAETLVSQLALALDSARLFQDAQRRAARERLTGEISARIRETLDVDTVLKTAADEVRRALGLPEVVIRLAPRLD